MVPWTAPRPEAPVPRVALAAAQAVLALLRDATGIRIGAVNIVAAVAVGSD